MEKVKIIYNPNAGRRILQKNIPRIKEVLKEAYGKVVDVTATNGKLHAQQLAFQSCKEGYDTIITVGGDGTINEVVNGIMESTAPCSLAIYPAGTVNDFGSYMKIPKNIEEFIHMLVNNKSVKVDVGVANNRYFLNVAAAGLLTDVPYRVSSEFKTVLGRFAYYIEGIKEFPRQIFKPIKIEIKIGEKREEKDILFLLLANSPTVGGFKYIAPQAKINDGLFDLLLVEKSQFIDVATIFFGALKGSHIYHPNLKYIQVNEFTVDCKENVRLDLDGELGGEFPMHFSVEKEALSVIVP